MEQKIVGCDGTLFLALKDSKAVFDLVEGCWDFLFFN